MKSKLLKASAVALLCVGLYVAFSLVTIMRVPSVLLLDYAINPEDLFSDKLVYFPGVEKFLVNKIRNMDEDKTAEIINDPSVTPYLVLSLASIYPDRDETKRERAVEILESLRNSGLSIYKLNRNECTSLFLAQYPVEFAHEAEREGHMWIAEYLLEVGNESMFEEANVNCHLRPRTADRN